MSDETPGVGQGALPPRDGTPSGSPRTVVERPAMRLTQVAGGQYVLTSQTPGGIPALAQLTPNNPNIQQGAVTRIISVSPSRAGQASPLRPSLANQSIVNVLTKPRTVNTNLRLQLFQNVDTSNINVHSGAPGSVSIPTQQSASSRSPVKRPLPATIDKKDTYSAKLQRVMNHRIVRSKLVKEKYNEHLLEMYFLESGGNILDLYQFAKRPKTSHYANYIKDYPIDPKEVEPVHSSSNITIPQTVSSTPTATPAASLPGLSHSSHHHTTPTSTSASHDSSSTPKTSLKHKVQQTLTTNQANQEQIVEKAKKEAYVVQRISDLQKEGLWSERRLPKVQEMPRPKIHWDYLLEEMAWLAADFAQERKWKKAAAKKCAKMVQKYFQDKAMAAQRAEKAHEQNLRRIASFCAKEIKNFWNNVEKLVEYKQHTILEEKRKIALDQQLSFIVDQTEKYSQLLAEGMNKPSVDQHAAVGSNPPSTSVSRVNSDDEFQPDNQSSSDDEETIAQEEATVDKARQSEEIAALQRESKMDLDDFLNELPKDYLQNRDKIRLSDSEDLDDKDEVPSEKASGSKDEDFTANSSSEEDDEATIHEAEQQDGEQNHAEEIDDLQKENDMSIEDLRKKYSDLHEVVLDESSNDTSIASEDAEESRHEAIEAENGSEVEEISRGEDDDDDDSENDSDVSESESEEEEEGDGSRVGLKSLIDDDNDVSGQSKSEKENELINDAAAIAESLQPTGNTLSSTTVSTTIPFLLKYTLREYQHIGLDWLVTMFERKLNGILADEMGLGKTIQTIALLAHLACEKENWGPHLIVVPTSVMLNWEMEIKKWCPGFKILTYYGSQKERKLKRTGWTKPNAFHICITSYKLVIQDHQSFRRKKWKYLILDEAQNIKNFKSQRWQLLLNFQTQQRLLLTGTPLQNNLMELWSLMHFLMPNVFQSHREFKEWFSNPVTGMIEGNSEYNENIIKRLHKVLRPFLLRRLKCEVEKQMPKKYEHVVMCRLSKRQRYLYDDYMSRSKTKETLASGNLLSVINILMQLRKVCNHPNLFEVRPTVSPFQCDGIVFHIPSNIFAMLAYNVWKHVNFSYTNLNLIGIELYLSAYECYRVRYLRCTRRSIQRNAYPEEEEFCPPTRVGMKVRKRAIKLPIKIEKKEPSNIVATTAAASPAKGGQQVQQVLFPPPQLLPPQQGGVKMKIPQQYGMQIVQQAGNIVKAIPVNISQGATLTTTALGNTSLLKTSDNKIAASFAQLVQTSTGKHLLLTSSPNVAANIPVSATAAGGQKLTFLSKQAVSTSGGNTHPLTKTFVKFQFSSVTAGTTNTVTTAPTTVPSSPSSSSSKRHSSKVGSKFIEQLYMNQTNSSDVPLPKNGENTEKEKEKKMEIDLSVRLKIMAKVNETRCTLKSLYGYDVHASFMEMWPLKKPVSTWYRGSGHVENAFYNDRGYNTTDFLREVLCTPVRRLDELGPLCDRFVFYVPPVRAAQPELQVWHPNPIVYSDIKRNTRTISLLFNRPATPLHKLASAMVTQFPDPRLIQYDCGKLQILDHLLRKLKSGGHRVLIFTQMTKMLDVLEAFLNFHGHIYLRLDGTTKIDQRQLLMERFNGDKRIFVFILSTRSGGVGVNLTGADTVIFYDSDWNPTMDAQAQDRCHRIGQTRDVHIYRLVSERTIEENILKKANQKRLLGDLAIEGGNFTTAYFKSTTIQDLFSIDANEESAANRMSLDNRDRSMSRKDPTLIPSRPASPTNGDQKIAIGALESALAACEDDQDVLAARTATAEAVADLAEFDENIPLEETTTVVKEKEPEMSKAEQEIDNVIKKLSPIERYAMNFIEQTESAWSAEQLAAAERLIEEQKIEWEQNRMAAMKEEEERRARELEEENDLITFAREDSTNQIWVSYNTMEQMPMWCPPTPPQQEGDVYTDSTMSFLYDTEVMSELNLPPVYVKKESKRNRLEAGLVESRRSLKVARKDDTVSVPRSLFHPNALFKIRRDQKWQKYRGLIRPTIAVAGKPAAIKPIAELPIWHDWTIHEDMALLKAIQNVQGLPLNLMVVSPGHTPNWDFVADYVNTVSITYRSAKQCRHRYETSLIQREEGKQVFDNTLRKKKNKSPTGQKFVFNPKTNRPLRTSQLYTQDNNSSFSQIMVQRFDSLKSIAIKRTLPTRSVSNALVQKNPKHTAVLNECGIDFEHPLLPIDVAARRAERIAREKKMNPEQQQAARLLMKSFGSAQTQAGSSATPVVVAAANVPTSVTVAQVQLSGTQTQGVVTTVTTTSLTTPISTSPNAIRGQRIIASPLQSSTVVSVSSLSPAHLHAATQRLIVSGAATQSQGKTVVNAQGVQGKAITSAQMQMIRQASLKQQLRLQAQGVKAVTIAGQPTVVQFTQAQPRAQFVRQGTVTVGGKAAITRTVTESEVAQILKKQQQLQQQKVLAATVGSQASTMQGTLTPQAFAQAIQAGTSGGQVATLVKTVSSTGATQTVTIPVSGVTLSSGKSLAGSTLKSTSPQLRQIQLHQHQQQLLAQKKLSGQKLSLAQMGKSNVQTQLIVGSKPLSTAMTVQQFQQVIRSPLGVSQGPVVLAKGSPRVIPVNTAQGTKQTIQVVAATTQGLTTTLRPQATSSTLAGALAGIKMPGQTSAQAQQALLSQVSAALQNQAVGVRQGSPVRIQTASGTPIVAVTVQSPNVQQSGAIPTTTQEQINRFLKK